jgi:starvation-inducible DNA-binding protein
MMKVQLMQQLLADLAVLNVKLHNIHWNVVGPRFMAIHEYTEKLYDGVNGDYDALAERLKMLGEFPSASLKDYLANAAIQERSSSTINDTEALSILKEDLTYLRDEYRRVRDAANEEDDFVTVALVEEEIAELEKELWFIRSTLQG